MRHVSGLEEVTIQSGSQIRATTRQSRRASARGGVSAANFAARAPDLTTRQRLEALRAQDDWWRSFIDEGELAPTAPSPIKPPWRAALCAAVALHLGLVGIALLHRDGPTAPAPGAGEPQFAVEMLPAWPEPGRRSAQLGSVTTPQSPHTSALAAGPPTAAASAAPVSEAVKAPIDPVRPAPTESSAAATQVATAAPAASAARTDIPPSTPSAAEALWEGDVLAKLARLKRYPAGARHAGQQDTVMVRFVVDRAGQVLSTEITQSRGFSALDNEARALVQRASPLPAPPASVSGEEIPLIAPIQFLLRKNP